jgi:hypothetical protein
LLRGRRWRILPARAGHQSERQQRQHKTRFARQGESDRHIRCTPRFLPSTPRGRINRKRGIFWIEAPFYRKITTTWHGSLKVGMVH